MTATMDALFILKRREDYGADPSFGNSYQIATGMWNSAMFMVQELNRRGLVTDIDMVIDGNGIDAVVTTGNPKIVVLEGIWVTPAKLAELMSLGRHAGRIWVTRVHSEIPFLAGEGIAMEWIAQYLALGGIVAPNAPRAHDQLRAFAHSLGFTSEQINELLPMLPNCFPTDFRPITSAELDTSSKPVLDIACFGAYRPLKNHLQQALIAIRFAESLGKTVRFHVNNRQDSGGAPVYKNVLKTFEALPAGSHELVLHPWENRETFLSSLEQTDLLMQLSFSETFNIVAADATWVGRPVLASAEIPWLYPITGEPANHLQSLKALETIWSNKSFFINQNRTRLRAYANRSGDIWERYVLARV
jgi:hypothetical protein